jgi:hypothetical protein
MAFCTLSLGDRGGTAGKTAGALYRAISISGLPRLMAGSAAGHDGWFVRVYLYRERR